MRRFSFLLLLLPFLLLSCRKETEAPEEASGKTVTYSLTGTLSERTRAFVSDDGVFSWCEDDEIAALDANSGELCIFTCVSVNSSGKAIFSYTGEEGRSFTKAWYPASMAKKSGGDVVISLPSSWKAAEVSQAKSFPMASAISGGSMSFRHLGGLLKITVKDVPKNASSVVLSSNVGISGDFPIAEMGLEDGMISAYGENVIIESGSVPVKSVQEIVPGGTESSVSIGELNLSAKGDVTAYIPLPCGSYKFKIALNVDSDTVFERETVSSKEIGRAHFVKMSALSVWPSTKLKAKYGSQTVDFVPSDLWGWYVAPALPAGQDIVIDDSGTEYGTRFATKKQAGYFCECLTGNKSGAFQLKAASDLYIFEDRTKFFPLAAGASGDGVVLPSEYEVAHYGLRGNFSGGSTFDTNAGVFERTDDRPLNDSSWGWYVVRNVLCSGTPISFKLYATPYSAGDGVLECTTATTQNVGVGRSLARPSGGESYSVKYQVIPGMSYDIYLKEDLTQVFVCEAGSRSSSLDEDYFTSLTSYGLYNYKGSSYVCASGTDQTWVALSGTVSTFTLAKGYTFDQIQMAGLPQNPSLEEAVSVDVNVTPSIGSAKSSTVTAAVKKIDGSKVWLLSGDGTGMIVNVQ